MTTTSSTISERVWRGQQSVELERVYLLDDGTRLRTRFDLDAYQFQSSARVDKWDGDAWQLVVRIAGQALACWEQGHRARSELTVALFEPDLTQIETEAAAIHYGIGLAP